MSEQETKLIELAEGLKEIVQNSASRLRNLRKHLTNIETQLDSAGDTIAKALKESRQTEVPLEPKESPTDTTADPSDTSIPNMSEPATSEPKRYYDSVAEEYKTFPTPPEPDETE